MPRCASCSEERNSSILVAWQCDIIIVNLVLLERLERYSLSGVSPHVCPLIASSSLLSLSSRQLREISDPITQLMATLHRLLSLTLSAAPSLQPHSARLLVLDRYQRSLFHFDMSPEQVKGELHRLSTCSAEGVWLLEEGAWSVGPRLLSKAFGEIPGEPHPYREYH